MTEDDDNDDGNDVFDVLIIGAGISGLGVACMIPQEAPRKTFLVLEERESIGGTWDLCRYPGVRSDSDVFTYSYGFRPWVGENLFGKGKEIKEYLLETAKEFGVEPKIRLRHKVVRAEWNKEDRHWKVSCIVSQDEKETLIFKAKFLVCGTGYYDFHTVNIPEFCNLDEFDGILIHPNEWPEDLDYTDKKVIIIGSGASAVTIAPTMAEKASHVTMLQRSPGYIVSMEQRDMVNWLIHRLFSNYWAFHILRWYYRSKTNFLYRVSRWFPTFLRAIVLLVTRIELGWSMARTMMKDFSPSYYPWDQRVCAASDGDFYHAMHQGKLSVVTDTIESFQKKGIQLKESGTVLDADIVVAATGFNLKIGGNIEFVVKDKPVRLSDLMVYKETLVEGMPNFALSLVLYAEASPHLKVDIVAKYLTALWNHMEDGTVVTPIPKDVTVKTEKSICSQMTAGYWLRGQNELPRQGTEDPWLFHMEHPAVVRAIGGQKVMTASFWDKDDALVFERLATDSDLTTPLLESRQKGGGGE